MKAEEVRKMDLAEMQKELTSLYREQFNLRMQKATAQLAGGAQLKKVRRDIARIKTIMQEQQKGEKA